MGSGSGGQIRTDDLMLMRHPRYSFSTPQWVVSYSLRLEVTFDTHCYAANIRFHQHDWGLWSESRHSRSLPDQHSQNQNLRAFASIPMRVGC